MTPIRTIASVAMVSLSALSAARAADAPAPAGPLAEACAQDVRALCPSIEPGEGRVLACLKEHRTKVSAACKAAVKAQRAERKRGGR